MNSSITARVPRVTSKRAIVITRIVSGGSSFGASAPNPIMQSLEERLLPFYAKTFEGALVAEGSVMADTHVRRKRPNACPIDSTRRNRIPLIANLWRRVQNRAEDGKNTVSRRTSLMDEPRIDRGRPVREKPRSIYHRRELFVINLTFIHTFMYIYVLNFISEISPFVNFLPICV